MAFIMEYEELKQLPKLDELGLHYGGDLFIENDKLLIKAMPEDAQDMVTYLTTLPEQEHVIKPITDGRIVYPKKTTRHDVIYQTSYRMKYLKDAKTLLCLYNEHLCYEKKIEYAKQLFSALQFLHQYIVIGDIHAKNILIQNENAYITDLDNARRIGEPWIPIDCYYYLNFFKSFGNTRYTDITKMYLECLSFLLEIDFSKFIAKYGYTEFYDVITSYHLPDEISTFLKLSVTNKLKKLGEEAYDFEKFITPDVLELKRTLNFFNKY